MIFELALFGIGMLFGAVGMLIVFVRALEKSMYPSNKELTKEEWRMT